MPFGQSNTPAVFHLLLTDIFRDMLNRLIFVSIDGVLIFLETKEERVKHVCLVLQCLLKNRLFVKAEKCDFHSSSVSLLGFVVQQGQLLPRWVWWRSGILLLPVNRFICDYRKMVALLTSLSSTIKAFQWSNEADADFSLLNVYLCSHLITPKSQPLVRGRGGCLRHRSWRCRRQQTRNFTPAPSSIFSIGGKLRH